MVTLSTGRIDTKAHTHTHTHLYIYTYMYVKIDMSAYICALVGTIKVKLLSSCEEAWCEYPIRSISRSGHMSARGKQALSDPTSTSDGAILRRACSHGGFESVSAQRHSSKQHFMGLLQRRHVYMHASPMALACPYPPPHAAPRCHCRCPLPSLLRCGYPPLTNNEGPHPLAGRR
ncbi:hypothetical protein TPHA_0C03510 [Tetrapisispora phaffii CBS 4417]|uniref:Uncharacterized protein n=1 Tax=Tetrapisispora phaffii (strain ATCC 24235 / CBS 4417 / NBRC 1672 / NRRL Y-8282 / UCD 70-5) TaxID=1071381 RepID=G8BQJ1_TETPH|nr:hypothetical protein TPHA_0C03510 [Tetrapisispora phaffii CBS 4417]CCE62503.1 hypothetical protein TPHA_0C03510 [Tetrapisispora phaffii CBS 4417]